MREIKFRGLCLLTNKFYYGGVDIERNTPCIISHGTRTFVSKKTIGQYTGLKDVNGVEIYEGDIVVNKLGRTCKIEWNEYQGCWDSLFIRDNCKNNEIDKSVGFKNRDFKYHVQLIGNIYENPELLKEITPN